jgi:hypothetical protein
MNVLNDGLGGLADLSTTEASVSNNGHAAIRP